MRQRLASLVLRLAGWRSFGAAPAHPKCVLVAAPHTSNWDFILLLLFSFKFRFRLRWMGKHTLFRGPMGWMMKRLGGIPIDRRQSNDLVQQMTDAFARSESLCLVIPPEGTRRAAPHWKSGFYHIARRAGVPIVLSFLDYRRKLGGVGPAVWPSGDVAADMEPIRDFYADKIGRDPAGFGPVRLRAEDESLASEPAA